MKKVLSVVLGGAALVAVMSGQAFAQASGQCSDCHTMHNSQNGTNMAGNGGPNPVLLMNTCLGCHTTPGNIPSGGPGELVLTKVPGVTTGSQPISVLAGGTFFCTTGGGAGVDFMGHNVDWVAPQDLAAFGLTPPGWINAYKGDERNAPAGPWATQLRCAGTYGCHGNRSVLDPYGAVAGAHHSNVKRVADVAATSVGSSFRFLNHVTGREDADYQKTTGIGDHNWYKGAANVDNDNTTVSFLCATCHGNFHQRGLGTVYPDGINNVVGGLSPWIRHPTDILLPQATTEYNNYNPETNGYVDQAPVGYTIPAVPARAQAVVLCISCHRAHGNCDTATGGADNAQYHDLLRFPYDTQLAGAGGVGTGPGCITCHNTK